MNKLKYLASYIKHTDIFLYFLFSFSLSLSLIFGFYFIFIQQINFVYVDANTRINIARRIIDSLTPGFGQIGAVWPPFPQIIMIPFVVSDYLWRTGIAGWIVSGGAYIISSLVIYKITRRFTESTVISLFSACIFLLNINVLYLQSTAMSESFFLMCIILIFYFTLLYIQTDKRYYLIICSVFTMISTLARFESYSIFIASIIIIILYTLLNKYKKSKIEGTLLLYLLPASFGIFLWTVYLWAIFGDPFFWLHYYASIGVTPTTHNVVHVMKPNLIQAAITYITAVININGLITAVFGFLSFLFVLVSRKIELKYKLLIIFPFMLFVFMLLSLSHNTVILQPQITLYNLLHKPNTIINEFNMRYGLLMLPYLIIFTSLLLKRFKFLIVVAVLLFLFQVITYFYTPYNLTYQLRTNLNYDVPSYISWFKRNYHGGLILISALVHDNEMNQLGVPYKRFIYEGTQHYWKDSLKEPRKYATWIIFSRNNLTDPVALAFKKQNLTKLGYALKYREGDTEVYEKTNN